jgi:hypothetical protein
MREPSAPLPSGERAPLGQYRVEGRREDLFGIPGNSVIAEVSPGKSADISVPLPPDLLFLQQQLGSGFFRPRM